MSNAILLRCGNATPGASIGSGPNSAGYPRLAVNFVGGTPGLMFSGTTSAGVPFSVVAALSNAIAGGFYQGIETSEGETLQTLISGWKTAALANGITLRVVAYQPGGQQQWQSGSGSPYYPWLAGALASASMWCYSSASGSGSPSSLGLYYYSSSLTNEAWLQLCNTNSQALSGSYSANGVTASSVGLAGASLYELLAQYLIDINSGGLGASKYGESVHNAACAAMDGNFVDNCQAVAPCPDASGSAKTSGTWNGLGTTPVLGSGASVVTNYQRGMNAYINAFRTYKSGWLSWANAGAALQACQFTEDLGSPYALDSSIVGLHDFAMDEACIGLSSGVEASYNEGTSGTQAPGYFMQYLIAYGERIVASTGSYILHQIGGPGGAQTLFGTSGSPTAQTASWTSAMWQALRFGAACAAMRGWHHMINLGPQNYSTCALMDELVQDGVRNWLSNGSQRLDPPQSGPNGNVTLAGTGNVSNVWVRRFPNGWVLWNPRQNGSVTITNIPTSLFRLSALNLSGSGGLSQYGDSSVNNGAQVSGGSVTLADADGLFLMGTG
jgi:hypothetical protein